MGRDRQAAPSTCLGSWGSLQAFAEQVWHLWSWDPSSHPLTLNRVREAWRGPEGHRGRQPAASVLGCEDLGRQGSGVGGGVVLMTHWFDTVKGLGLSREEAW